LHIVVVCAIKLFLEFVRVFVFGFNTMELAELKTAISDLQARIERIRDWL
jgi:hypothetical protein